MEDYMSGYLEDFINFLDATEEQFKISAADLSAANIDLQDLGHFIEFGNADGRSRLKVYSLYKQTQHKRRVAKETMEWCEKNRKVIQGLRELLGQVRKIEKSQANRAYAIRGHILDEITPLSHLTERGK